MEFEEIATHFGYSLGIGAVPVKKFGITDRHRDGTKRRREIVVADSGMNIGRGTTSGWWPRSTASPKSAS